MNETTPKPESTEIQDRGVPCPGVSHRAIPGYEILELVGQGGMGKVYRARQCSLGRIVAVKVLAHELDEKLVARFREEARSVAKLQHPNIAQLFESGSADGKPFYSQEYLEGGSLAKKIAGLPQDPRYSAQLIVTLARAIQHSHEQGVLHRDLKPGNILLAADGTPKVTDFGLAKDLHGQPQADTPSEPITRTGEILGTPGYMPPEQASGVFASIGPPADVYALGAILYELLTGRPPFQAPDPLQTLLMVLSMEPVSPRILQPKLPRDLETICLKCLEKSPKSRYPSAKTLAEDLQRFLEHQPIVARPVGWVGCALKWANRKPWQAAACGLLLLGIVGLILGQFYLNGLNQQLVQASDYLTIKNRELEETNQLLEKSKSDAESLLASSLQSIDDYHFDLASKLADVPKSEKLRIQVLAQAKAFLERLHDLNSKRESVREYLLIGFNKLGDAQMRIGDLEAAAASFDRAIDAADRLLVAHPENISYRVNRAGAIYNAAGVTERLGRKVEADRLRRQAELSVEELYAEQPRSKAVLELKMNVNRQQLIRAYESGKNERIEAALRHQYELAQQLLDLAPNESRYLIDAAGDALYLVEYLKHQRMSEEATKVFAQAEKWLGQISNPNATEARVLQAKLCDCRGSMFQEEVNHARANEEYRKGLAIYQKLAEDFPNSPRFRINEANSLIWIGLNHQQAKQTAEAHSTFAVAKELILKLSQQFPDDTTLQEKLRFVEDTLRTLPRSPLTPKLP